jgi:5-methylthioadenosine/S-adenosylhomocysteine deaminase
MFEEGTMRSLSRDWFRATLFVSSVLTASVLFSPAAWAAERPTLIRNASLILTMDPAVGQGELGVIADADVLIEGETIAAVGKQLARRGTDVVDAAAKIVMPGFVDTHNHLWQSLIRGCGTHLDLNGCLCVSPVRLHLLAR